MFQKNLRNILRAGRSMSSFFVPMLHVPATSAKKLSMKKTTILIPTYKPSSVTLKLIKDVLTFNPGMHVVVIDDCTPANDKASAKIFAKIRMLQKQSKKITLLTTPSKQLKASALNYGLSYLSTKKVKPEVVITVDDDVIIASDTFAHLIEALHFDKTIGAVCSMARVKNKDVNLLTRLQALEYHGFNITKISDNGFLLGPLVMPGMLTAFKYETIKAIRGFSSDKLLEDYDITVRVKNAGYRTAIISRAVAWTYAPETLRDLGKQRIRWSYGGLVVVKDFYRSGIAIFQDLIGHVLFVSLFTLIVLSFLVSDKQGTPSVLVMALIFVAVLHFMLAFIFGVLTLKTYPERDRKDWLIKLSVLPEFAYSNLLSGILVGAYMFLIFNLITNKVVEKLPSFFPVQKIGHKGFSKLGYSAAWGTRN